MKSLSRVRLFATPWTVGYQALGHGIFQARVLEWVAISFSINNKNWKKKKINFFLFLAMPRGMLDLSSQTRGRTWVPWNGSTAALPLDCRGIP